MFVLQVWTMLMQAKSEMADLQQEHQREMEGLLENVRQLSRELRLHMLLIDNFIPPGEIYLTSTNTVVLIYSRKNCSDISTLKALK